MQKQMILTSERHGEHSFAGQNTQQIMTQNICSLNLVAIFYSFSCLAAKNHGFISSLLTF